MKTKCLKKDNLVHIPKPKPYPPNRTNYTEYWKSKQNLYVNEKKVVRIIIGGKNEK